VGDGAKGIVGRFYDLLNAGDLDGMAALIDDDAELALKVLPGAKNDPDWTLKGPAGFVKYAEQAQERFDDYKIKTTFGQFGSGGVPLARVAYTEVKVPGAHRMRVTGFNSENRRFLMVGREDWISNRITQR
jgi:hypothetical protein